jgi:hypothetical protein
MWPCVCRSVAIGVLILIGILNSGPSLFAQRAQPRREQDRYATPYYDPRYGNSPNAETGSEPTQREKPSQQPGHSRTETPIDNQVQIRELPATDGAISELALLGLVSLIGAGGLRLTKRSTSRL